MHKTEHDAMRTPGLGMSSMQAAGKELGANLQECPLPGTFVSIEQLQIQHAMRKGTNILHSGLMRSTRPVFKVQGGRRKRDRCMLTRINLEGR